MTSQLFIVVCSVCSLVLVTATAWMTWKLSIALRRMRLAHADTWAPEPPRRRRRTASELARDAEQFYACLLNEDPSEHDGSCEYERSVRATFERSSVQGVEVGAIDCRRTLCRVHVLYSSGSRDQILRLMREGLLPSTAFITPAPGGNGDWLYLPGHGASLPMPVLRDSVTAV